jgi:hypothetical protein
MAVVLEIKLVPSSAHEVSWLDYEIPIVGAIFRQPIGEVNSVGNKNLLGARELGEKCNLDRQRL